jgi:hypothetical protein
LIIWLWILGCYRFDIKMQKHGSSEEEVIEADVDSGLAQVA